jgi:hypothetical protein
MELYRNLEGTSGVTSYAVTARTIAVQFNNGSIYLYDYQNPGAAHVERMKALAHAGRGLSTYISQVVRENYAKRLR